MTSPHQILMISRRKAGRYVPLAALIFFLVTLLVSSFFIPTALNSSSNVLLVAITAIYAYFTYALLRATKVTKNSPHLTSKLLLISKIGSPLYLTVEQYIEKSEDFLRILRALAENATEDTNNYVFISIENTGESLAISPKMYLTVEKLTAIDGASESCKELHFQDLKPGERIIKLISVFTHPSPNDHFRVKEANLTYSDIGAYNEDMSPDKFDVRTSLGNDRDDDVQIVLKD